MGAAVVPRLAFAAETDLRPRFNAGGNGDRETALSTLRAASLTGRAGFFDDSSLAAARATIARPDETLVKLTLAVPQGTYLAPLLDQARQLFPRLYGNVDCAWTDAAPLVPSVAGLNPANVEETVRRYLEEQQMPDDERAELMALVAELRAVPAGADE